MHCAWGLFLSSEKGECLLKDVKINGKSLEEIERELSADFPDAELKVDQEGAKYVPVESYEKRLNAVIGVLNYDRITTEGGIHRVADRYVITTSTMIEIRDGDGNVVIRKSQVGGSNVIILSSGEQKGQPKNLKSDVSAAGSESFKNCCKLLQVGIKQIREQRAKKKKTTQPSNQQDVRAYRVVFETSLSSGNGYYSAEVVNCETNQHLRLMIFKKSYVEIEKYITMAEFIKCYQRGTKLSFYGYENEYRGKSQLIFSRPNAKSDKSAE